jgi:hypothetical protein
MIIKMLKSSARWTLKKTGVYPIYYIWRWGYLREWNWYQSFNENRSIGPGGKPLPWITYPAIDFLDERLNKQMSVFEFGCGGSTFWWAERTKSVDSVEHLKNWFDDLRVKVPANVDLHLVELQPNGAYCRTPMSLNRSFDLVMIDGRDRVNCAIQSVGALKPDGVILWDNAERTEYQAGYDFLKAKGFKRLDFYGMGPSRVVKWSTALFYRSENVFGL